MSTHWKAISAGSLPELAERLNEENACGYNPPHGHTVIQVQALIGGDAPIYEILVAKTTQVEPTGGETLDRMT